MLDGECDVAASGVLEEATRVALAFRDLDELLDAIPRLLCRWGASSCVVDFGSGTERRRVGAPPWPSSDAGGAACALVSEAITCGHPVVVGAETWGIEDGRLGRFVNALRAVLGCRSFVVFPLLGDSGPVGAVTMVFSNTSVLPDIATFDVLAARLGVALEHAHAYASVRAERDRYAHALSFASHSLRGPLSEVQFALSEAHRGSSPQESRRRIERAQASASELEERLGAVLEIAHAETRRLRLDLTRTRPSALVSEALAVSVTRVTTTSVAVCSDASEELPEVVCDRRRIVRALAELVGQAIQRTARQGRVLVSARGVRAGVVFEIADGTKHADTETTPEAAHDGGGLTKGIGFALAKAFVRAHGIDLHIEKVPGDGTVFAFTLPLASMGHPEDAR